jgi:hypothetical protein
VNDKLFIPQAVLDKWVESGKVVFNDNHLTLPSEKKTYTLTSAVRFMSLLDGEDKAKLLGRLRTIEKLNEIGAEHMSDSVILGDTAYQVQEGFIAIVLVDEEVAVASETRPAAPAVQPAEAAPSPVVTTAPPKVDVPVVSASEAAAASTKTPPPAEKPVEITATPATESADAELLTKFLLNNLNF